MNRTEAELWTSGRSGRLLVNNLNRPVNRRKGPWEKTVDVVNAPFPSERGSQRPPCRLLPEGWVVRRAAPLTYMCCDFSHFKLAPMLALYQAPDLGDSDAHDPAHHANHHSVR